MRGPQFDIEDTLAGQIITAEIRKLEEKLRRQKQEEQNEARELQNRLRHEQEALWQEQQSKREQEAAMFRRSDSRNLESARHDRRSRSSRDGREKLTGSGDTSDNAMQAKWGGLSELLRRSN